MYNFHKVKNKEGLHEFKHEHFRRGQRELLPLITRKITEVQETPPPEPKDTKPASLETGKLKKTILENKESYNLVSAQTKLVIDTNKDLIYKIWQSKTDNDVKIRKLLFLFFSLLSNPHPDLLTRVKEVFMTNAGMEMSQDAFTLNLANVSMFIGALIQNVFTNDEKEDSCVDALMKGFLEVQNSLETEEANKFTMEMLVQQLQINLTPRPGDVTPQHLGMLTFPQFMRSEDNMSLLDQMSGYNNSVHEAKSVIHLDIMNFRLGHAFNMSKTGSRKAVDDHSLYGGLNGSAGMTTPRSDHTDKDSLNR